jgi:hypothetical protein
MTKKLESLFNLPPSDDVEDGPTLEEAKAFVDENRDAIAEVDFVIDKIDHALPLVHSLDTSDEELDELAKLAKDKAEDLIDLGMNVEPRFSGVILQTAGIMLGHAISAKTAKLDKKLKMVSLQLSKAKLDYQKEKDKAKAAGQEGTPADTVDGKGIVLDRNELLKHILGKQDK